MARTGYSEFVPAYCDVALPVPLDRTFTYALDPGILGAGAVVPVVGARVLVPFRNEKLSGVIVRVHDDTPAVETRAVLHVLDEEAPLSPGLLKLAQWIASYYIAPIGEVLRAMLPLMSEVQKQVLLRITDAGRAALAGLSNQDAAYKVLAHLDGVDGARLPKVRSVAGSAREVIPALLRKKWIARETMAAPRDARRLVRVAVLVEGVRLPKLNANQQAILAELAGAGNELPVGELRRMQVPQSTLATLVRRGSVRIEERQAGFELSRLSALEHPQHMLNEAQMSALGTICSAVEAGEFRPHLLHGVTGSGKTAVYLAAMRRTLALGKSAILLVPEIGLTPAMAAQLHQTFGEDVALLHSALTPEERGEQWHRIRRGAARVVVGTRSAVFAPVENLGLIIVDEEHDASYKQESTPRYHARDTAVMRAKLEKATVVLGSATPSLETWHNAERGRYTKIEMRERVNDRPLPEVALIDMRREFEETGQEHLFSRALITETEATLARGEQAIILLNRRGYSFVVICRACGEKLECENCSISLTYHKPVPGADDRARAGQHLECHYCGYRRTVPKRCPKCDSEYLYFLGAGSEQGEERLQEIFPHARIGRMDRDTVRGRADMERLLLKLHTGEINLLVGTQMIAKGHDIHGVTLVGVVGADFALGLPDFRAAERVFQLLTQVSGRAGRGELPGKVLVQTYHQDHYAIQFAAKHDFDGFVAKEMKYRRWMHYPPCGVLANLVIHSKRMEEAAGWAAVLGKWFAATPHEGVRVLGPATAPLARIKCIFRFHLVLKAENRQVLARTLREALAHADAVGVPRRNLIVDVDAVSLM